MDYKKLIDSVHTFLNFCKKASNGFISSKDSREYTDEYFTQIFPSWNDINISDKYVPDKKLFKDNNILALKNIDPIVVKPFYEGKEKLFLALYKAKKDYDDLQRLGGLYNYIANRINRTLNTTVQAEMERMISYTTDYVYKNVEKFDPAKASVKTFTINMVDWVVKTHNRDVLTTDDMKVEREKARQKELWLDEYERKKKKKPSQVEVIDWEMQYDQKARQWNKTKRTRTTIDSARFELNDSESEGRDSILDNLISKSTRSFNSPAFDNVKKDLFEMISNKGLSAIQKGYLEAVINDEDEEMWIKNRINFTYFMKKFNTSRTTVINEVKHLMAKIHQILKDDDELEALKESLTKNASTNAELLSIKKLILQILDLNEEKF